VSPRHLSTDEPEVLALLRDAPAVAFGIDYDGTLAPIVARPELATATDEVVACVERLAEHPRDLVAIVTGRSVEDLWERARTRRTWVLGRHGAQIAAPGGEARLADGLDEARLVDGLSAVRAGLEEALGEIAGADGAFIEDKGAGFALHTRGVSIDTERALRDRLGTLAAELDTHVLLRGKRVLELRPRGVDKGQAFTALRAAHAPRAQPLYIGDDTTDEDAFRALGPDAVTIRVSDDPQVASAARYRVDDPAGALAFLSAVSRVRHG